MTSTAKTRRREDASGKGILVGLVVVSAALAGCAGNGAHSRCPEEFPLAFRGYPAVGVNGTYEFQSTLWNCTDRAILLDEPCEGRNGIVPRVTVGNETYYASPVGSAERALVPREQLACSEWPTPATEAGPGFWSETRYLWDGTYRPQGGQAVPLPEGAYVFTVEAGVYRQAVEVRVPW